MHWPEGSSVRHFATADGGVVLDAALASNADSHWLDLQWWRERGSVSPAGEGRGSAHFIAADTRELVLRHYRRGGLAARLSRDRYLWRGPARTRSFAEWHLLYLMRQSGLPVPAPVAARYRRRGASYDADLLTERVPGGASSLDVRLRDGQLRFEHWVAIGRIIRSFHDAGICHADLNCHNVLLDDAGYVWLIDFDRARLRSPGMWSDANLARLYRSLDKLRPELPADRFTEADWSALLDGYFAARDEFRRGAAQRAEQERLAALLK